MDPNYAVIPNIEIELVGPQTHTTHSDSNGNFELQVDTDGVYVLQSKGAFSGTHWAPICKAPKLNLTPSKGHGLQHVDLVIGPRPFGSD